MIFIKYNNKDNNNKVIINIFYNKQEEKETSFLQLRLIFSLYLLFHINFFCFLTILIYD